MIGHDSVLTLCDGTDRGIITVSDFTATQEGLLVDVTLYHRVSQQ